MRKLDLLDLPIKLHLFERISRSKVSAGLGDGGGPLSSPQINLAIDKSDVFLGVYTVARRPDGGKREFKRRERREKREEKKRGRLRQTCSIDNRLSAEVYPPSAMCT